MTCIYTGTAALPTRVVTHMVTLRNASMMQVEKRYNYTTPKTFLELIKLYKSVLARKRNQVQEAIDRLDTVSRGAHRYTAAWRSL